jgi:hypothetical protein
MTKDIKDEPHPTPRPSDPFTSQDGVRLFNQISQEIARLSGVLGTMSGTLANILNKQITALEQMNRLEEGLAGSRINRLEQEVREAERELEAAEAARKAAEDKLRIKSESKDNNLDTQEKLKRIVNTEHENLERDKRAALDAKIQDLKWTMIKTAANWGTVGVLAIISAVIWFFLRQYIAGLP